MKLRAIIIVVVLVAAVGAVVALKQRQAGPALQASEGQQTETSGPVETAEGSAEAAQAVPMLLDLGASKCIPCKMMESVLNDLSALYEGKLRVEFIDVWKNPRAGKVFRVNLIPTQIFYDAEGRELFRHEGYWSREDIVHKFKELGIDLEKGKANDPSEAPTNESKQS